MIHVLATIKLHPNARTQFLEAFRSVVPLVRAEPGCIEYDAAIDLATGLPAQQPLRENVVMVIEKWSDLDALKRHLSAAHMQEYRARVKNLVEKTELQVLEPAD